MKTLESWLSEYEVSHRHPTNVLIHKICVPMIFLAITAMIYAIPTPGSWASLGFNWSYLFLLFVFIRYLKLSQKLGLVMGGVFILISFLLRPISMWLGNSMLALLSFGVFVLAWIFQFIGHKVEGRRPSFLNDLHFLLIGPLWTFYKTFHWPKVSEK